MCCSVSVRFFDYVNDAWQASKWLLWFTLHYPLHRIPTAPLSHPANCPSSLPTCQHVQPSSHVCQVHVVGYIRSEVEWAVLCSDSAECFPRFAPTVSSFTNKLPIDYCVCTQICGGGVRDRFVRRWLGELLPNILRRCYNYHKTTDAICYSSTSPASLKGEFHRENERYNKINEWEMLSNESKESCTCKMRNYVYTQIGGQLECYPLH